MTLRQPGLAAALLLTALGCGGGEEPGSSGGGKSSTGAGGGEGGSGATAAAGAALDCAPGELLGDGGTCLRPGIAEGQCGAGFTHDGDAGCEPVLPASACSAAQMAVPGDASCRSVSPCPISDAPTAGNTQYVDAGFGGTSNGSAQAPWTTIAQAVSAAADGAVIAIAAGTYAQSVSLSKPVRLWGACSEAVFLTGGVTITADGAELHALAITGSQAGVSVDGATGIVLERVRVHDTGWIGVDLRDDLGPTSVIIEDSLVENATSVGVYAEGSEVTLRRTEVRNVQSLGGDFGYGVSGRVDAATGRRSRFTFEQAHVHGLTTAGVLGWGVDVTMDDSVVSDVGPRPMDGAFGYAVGVERDATTGERSAATIRGSVIEKASFCGVCTWDSELEMDRSVVRDITSEVASGEFGWGVKSLDIALDEPLRPVLSVQRTLIERTQQMGLGLFGTDATVRQIVVRDVAGRTSDGRFGHLISAQSTFETEESSHLDLRGAKLQRGFEVGLAALGATIDAEAVLVEDVSPRPDGLFGAPLAIARDIVRDIPAGGTVRQVVLDGGHTAGFAVLGADVEATDLVVRDIRPDLYSDQFGDGVIASSFIFSPTLYETSLSLARATVEGAPRAGIASFSSMVSVSESALECNAIDLDAEPVLDGEVVLENGGGNRCGCGQDQEECKVLQTGLEPPTPPI